MIEIIKKICIFGGLIFLLGACAEGSIFPNIPLTLSPPVLANPISMVGSAAASRLYVVNSNNRVNFFDASFLIFDITNPVSPVAIAAISIANFSGQIILDEIRGFVYIPNRQSSDDSDSDDNVLRININEASPGFLSVELFASGDSPFGAFFDDPFFFAAAVNQCLQYNVDSFAGYSQVDLSVVTADGRQLNADDTRELAIAPSNQTIFVTNRADNMLILNRNEFPAPTAPGVTDLGQEPVDYIVLGTNSTRGADRDSSFVYVVDGIPPLLRILTDTGLDPVIGAPVEIAISSLEVASIPVGNDPGEVLVDEPNMRAYVTNTGEDTVSIIDLNLQQEIARISISTTDTTSADGQDDGDQPFGMALVNLGGTNYLYVAHFQTSLISVINADTLTLLNTFPPEM